MEKDRYDDTSTIFSPSNKKRILSFPFIKKANYLHSMIYESAELNIINSPILTRNTQLLLFPQIIASHKVKGKIQNSSIPDPYFQQKETI